MLQANTKKGKTKRVRTEGSRILGTYETPVARKNAAEASWCMYSFTRTVFVSRSVMERGKALAGVA